MRSARGCYAVPARLVERRGRYTARAGAAWGLPDKQGLSVMMEEFNERNRLEALIKQMAPTWDITGSGGGSGGFDVSIDLPDGTYLTVDGGVRTRDLEWLRYGSDQTQDYIDLELGEFKATCDAITAAFYPEVV